MPGRGGASGVHRIGQCIVAQGEASTDSQEKSQIILDEKSILKKCDQCE